MAITGTIRPVATFDSRGDVAVGWEAYRADGVLIAWSPEKDRLQAVLVILNPDLTFVEEAS